jgi:hypothetical protein
MPDGIQSLLETYARAISNNAEDWDNPKIKANKKKGTGSSQDDSTHLSSDDTYATQVGRVMMTLDVHKGTGSDNLTAGIAREMAQRMCNQFRGEFNRDLNVLVKENRVSQKDKDRWNELDIIEKADKTIRQGQSGELTSKEGKELAALWKKLNNEYKEWRGEVRKVKTTYEVPDYLLKHHWSLLALYNDIQKTMKDAGSTVMTDDRDDASTPYNWKKKGKKKKD